MAVSAQNLAEHLELDQIDGLIAAAGVDGTKEIMATFWRSTSELLDTLASQIEQNALNGAAATAHAIKGSAANVGALRLANAASQLEDVCKCEAADQARATMQVIREEFAAVRSCFDQHLAKA